MCVRRTKGNSGFTLIELLVVIAIIAILAAILFPVFLTARQRAQVANCIAVIKQVGQASQNYSSDYDNSFPWAPAWAGAQHTPDKLLGYPVGQYWGGDSGIEQKLNAGIPSKEERPLWKYTKTVSMFRCPADIKRKQIANATTQYSDFEWWGNSYPMNSTWDVRGAGLVACVAGENVVRSGGGITIKYPRKTNSVRRPTRVVLAGDRTMHTFFWQPNTTDQGHRNHDKDRPMSVVVFCDGHAKMIKMTPSHEVNVGGGTVKTEGVWDEVQGWALMERGWIPGYPEIGMP